MFKLIKILAIVFFLVIAVVIGIIMSTDVNQYKGDIIQIVKEKTGRDFQIKGDLKIAPSLIPTIAVEGVTLGNAEWASAKQAMVSVGKFEAEVSLIPLLKQSVQVNKLILIKPEIYLETNNEGVGNWVLNTSSKSEASDKETTASIPALNVQEVLIKEANLNYKDGKTGKETKLTIDVIQAESTSLDAPLSLLVKAALNEAPIELNGSLGSVNALISNQEFPLNISGQIDNASLSAEGKISKPQEAKGLNLQIAFAVNTLADLARIAGSDMPDAGPIAINGELKDVDGGYAINGMSAKIMEHEVKGDASISTSGPRPALTANLSAEKLDLSAFTNEEETEKKEHLFSKEPLALEGLKSADVNLKFKTAQLITPSLNMNNVSLNFKLNNGNLNIAPLSGDYAGGKLSVNVGLDGSSGKSAILNTDINLKQIELGLIPQLQEKELLTGGKTDVTIKLKGSGSSVAGIMSGSNGEILVKTGSGKILNDTVDMAGADVVFSALNMLNPLAEKEKHTTMECAVVNFNIKEGIATTNKGIALQTAKMNVVGSGTIDLKTEQLDLGVKPHAREGLGISLGSLVDMVRIGGTLAKPSPKVDASGALSAGISAGAAVATGGLSLLAEGLFDKTTADGNPCDTALGKAPVKTAKPAEEKKSAPVEAATKAVDTVKDAAGGAIKGLKGLFD